MTTPYHAKYFAHELTQQAQPGGVDRLSMALFDACVDLNPHQIEAAMFALRSPLLKGVVLADEVGLGKTIEAGLVLCQHWAERKRKLLVICPASLRKQWSLELQEKFNLPTMILDSKTYREAVRDGNATPFASDKVIITSFHFASRFRGDIRAVLYDLVVIDEAHKLRNAYRPSNKMGQNIKWAIEERKKCLLTATPLQNSLLELYGLSTILDDLIFGDMNSFRTQYTNAGADLNALRGRLQSFCKRTLRRQVVEYIKYTERIPFTVRFRPTDDEQKLYESVSDFLNREETYSVPPRQRHLTALILRKLLASSSHAIANTLETMKSRLEEMRDVPKPDEPNDNFMEELIENEELEDDYLDEILEGTTDEEEQAKPEIDRLKLGGEIDELARYAQWARSIGIDTKSRSLLKALELGFAEMDKMGAKCKALVFTESRRTQDYLKNFLESNGYGGQIVLFNGTNADPDSRRIIDKWIEDNAATGRVTGSRPIDSRTALIEHFQNHATVMVATEAAAEGVNMQFCSLVINYDMPISTNGTKDTQYAPLHDPVGGDLMWLSGILNDNRLFFPRVRYIALEDVMFLYRWCFTDSEILALWEEGRLLEMRELKGYVTFRHNAKVHRRREYAGLVNRHGWMRVALGSAPEDREGAYLLCSAFNSLGEPLEFFQIDAYFDFVQSRQSLERIRNDVEHRLQTDIERHCELSQEHLKQKIRKAAKEELSKQETEFEILSASAQSDLENIRRQLRHADDQSERDALVKLRHDIRQHLLKIESAEIEAIRRSLSDRQNVELKTVTLFTLAWSVEKD